MFFRMSTQSLERRQSMMPLFEFPEHAAESFWLVLCLRNAHARAMTSYDEPWRTWAGNHRLNHRCFASHWGGYWLSSIYMIIRLTIASIDGEDFSVACVGSRFNVAPTET